MNISKSAVIVGFSNSSASNSNLLPTIRSLRKGFMPKRNKISVVVPVFNEIDAIKAFHTNLILNLQRLNKPNEIIYIDDNSDDGTYEWLLRENEQTNQNIKVLRKQGRKGKAYSLIQGFDNSTGSILVMIDADLQYPPSQIIPMIKRLKKTDVVVANRQYGKISYIRKVISKTFRKIFGKTLFGLDCDIQSGLKVFKREVYETIKFTPSSPWSFDLEFLHRAKFAGFNIENHNIIFIQRVFGKSKISLMSSIFEIGGKALTLKFLRLRPVLLQPHSNYSMRGADRKSTRLNSSHSAKSRMPSSA